MIESPPTAVSPPPGRPMRSTSSGAGVRSVGHPDASCVTVLHMLSISNDPSSTIGRPDPRAAAADCVVAYGVDRMTLAEIARRARVSRPTVYRRWPDTRSILRGTADLADRRCARRGAEPRASAARRWSSASSRSPNGCDVTRSSCRCCSRHPTWRWSTSPSGWAPASRSSSKRSPPTIKLAQEEGSVRTGDPRQLAAMCLLITQSTIQSAPDRRAHPGRRRPRRRTGPLTERIPETLTGSTALNETRRAAELAALADGEPLDVIVIGGGITGTGIALDAATRGLTRGVGGEARSGVRHQPVEFQAGAWRAALPGDRQCGHRPAQRRRTRNPDDP